MATANGDRHLLCVSSSWSAGTHNLPSRFYQKLTNLVAEGSCGHNWKVFATTVKEHNKLAGTRELKSAANSSVTLLGYKEPWGCIDKSSDSWLNITPHCHYRGLRTALDSQADVIIAEGPTFAWGGVNIREGFFPTAQLVLFNRSFQDGLKAEEEEALIEQATQSDLVLSIDQDTFQKYESVYQKAPSTAQIKHQLLDINALNLDMLSGKEVLRPGSPFKKTSVLTSQETPKKTGKAKDETDGALAATMNQLSISPGISPCRPEHKWHKTITPQVMAFHESCAKYPDKAISSAMPYFQGTMTKVEGHLKEKNLCVRFEYTGSAYEKVMVNEHDLEFDLMIIMTEGDEMEMTPLDQDPTNGYFLLTPKAAKMDQFEKWLHSPAERVVSPHKLVSSFFGSLQKAVNATAGHDKSTKLRMHGPAIQLDVYHDATRTQKWFSVDIVPCIQIRLKKGEPPMLFVAKPFKNMESSRQAWRRSFSVEEKAKFKNIDASNGCRRMCVRLLKAMVKPGARPKSKRGHDSSFSHITSFMIKNALFHENDRKELDWGQEQLGLRVLGLISRLADYFEKGFFAHYFLPEVNLLAGVEDTVRDGIAKRLRRLLNSQVEFCKVIEADGTFCTNA